ncbi:hypothetical protein GCM10023322_08620 [Rugosimonospora acidiphila]|uniref:Methyltransferase type 11 domain-containing protein n=1 Tax=Rugosimonospora acidiphila TaxID=556531 RepID=A0ABP9RL46_9ACTN
MKQDQRAPFVAALERARQAAYPPGEYVGQESFVLASEIRELAGRARIGSGVSVLDACCGVAGPGRLITAEFGCQYLGVDYSASGLEIARELAGNLPCRFDQARIPPLPDDPVEVVLLLETMLAFADKRTLLGEVARALQPGGRFAFTVEEGGPLTPAERDRMPDADTAWPIELAELTDLLADVGLTITWQSECTKSHAETAAALLYAYRADAVRIANHVGARGFHELVAAHELWADWLSSGRMRKFAIVAEKL